MHALLGAAIQPSKRRHCLDTYLYAYGCSSTRLYLAQWFLKLRAMLPVFSAEIMLLYCPWKVMVQPMPTGEMRRKLPVTVAIGLQTLFDEQYCEAAQQGCCGLPDMMANGFYLCTALVT